jgi:hypothetical protein
MLENFWSSNVRIVLNSLDSYNVLDITQLNVLMLDSATVDKLADTRLMSALVLNVKVW